MSNGIFPIPEPLRRVSLRRCSFRFEGRPESVKDARDWLSVHMTMTGVPDNQADTAVLLLSELATNALLHTADDGEGGAFCVRAFFLYGRLRVRVEVRDAGRTPFPIRAAAPDPEAENGRGLLLVDTLADRWGCFESGRGPGVFFELRWTTQPTRTASALSAESSR